MDLISPLAHGPLGSIVPVPKGGVLPYYLSQSHVWEVKKEALVADSCEATRVSERKVKNTATVPRITMKLHICAPFLHRMKYSTFTPTTLNRPSSPFSGFFVLPGLAFLQMQTTTGGIFTLFNSTFVLEKNLFNYTRPSKFFPGMWKGKSTRIVSLFCRYWRNNWNKPEKRLTAGKREPSREFLQKRKREKFMEIEEGK